MSEFRTISIVDLIKDRVNRTAFLPAIQREYVWEPWQIDKLFDSLMCKYPISTFLFWSIREEDRHKWLSYEFIRDFDEEHPHNNEANLGGVNNDIHLVLDGQQRITSLYIGLRGTYRWFYRKWHKGRLYLNLFHKPSFENPEEMAYQFRFRENDLPDARTDEPQLWYRVGEILDYDDAEDAKEAIEHRIDDSTPRDQRQLALKMVGELHNRIWTQRSITFYDEKSSNYDQVVEIFVRTNSGGKKLEYSDILLSQATAKWSTLNAREEINSFTDELNSIGSGYSFGKDFVMKGALYLSGLDIAYRLKNFTRENLAKIEERWPMIKEALRASVALANRFGICDKNLVSKLALLPIAQYIGSKANISKWLASTEVADNIDRLNINRWLIIATLRNAFGAASDQRLSVVRKVISGSGERFPFRALNSELGIRGAFTRDEIAGLLSYKYASRYSYLVLSLLYDGRQLAERTFQEDHIYPKSAFTQRGLKAIGISSEQVGDYLASFNTIQNLELIDSVENNAKLATPFDKWIASRGEDFKRLHMIPNMDDYSLQNFLSFIQERRKLITERFEQINIELSLIGSDVETISESIKGLTTIESIDKFNLQYNAIVIAVQQLATRGFFDGENSYSDFLATLNHIANYHIIRIANAAYEKYEKGGREDKSWLATIERCRSSIKEHEDKQVEYDLLDDLCERLGARS